MSGSARLYRRRSHIQHAHGLMVCESTSLHHFHGLQLLQTRLLCNLVLSLVGVMLKVAYIGDVAHITYLVAQMFEQFHEHIVCHARSCMAQVCISIYCRTADIKPYMSFIDRLEQLLLPRKRIGYI